MRSSSATDEEPAMKFSELVRLLEQSGFNKPGERR
jgi:predicted RNA binding protein YcfA (HicA-like mRNA interferase family)